MPVKLRLVRTFVAGFAIMFPALARLGRALIGVQPAL